MSEIKDQISEVQPPSEHFCFPLNSNETIRFLLCGSVKRIVTFRNNLLFIKNLNLVFADIFALVAFCFLTSDIYSLKLQQNKGLTPKRGTTFSQFFVHVQRLFSDLFLYFLPRFTPLLHQRFHSQSRTLFTLTCRLN